MATGTTVNNQQLITFFDPGTTSTNSTAYNIPFSKGLLIAQGTWTGGATVTFYQSSPYGGVFVPVNDITGTPISWTSNNSIGLDYIVWNQLMYATISSAGASTSLIVTLQRTQ